MKKFIAEFKEFAFKGNMLDLAIGMVIATAFNAIVGAIVNSLIMPIFGAILGGQDLSTRYFELNGVEIFYGVFLQALVDFLIIAFCLFLVVKMINKIKKQPKVEEPAAPAPKPDDIALLEEIRDLLAKEKVNQ